MSARLAPAAVPGPSEPDRCTIVANTIAPRRLPARQASSVRAARTQEIDLVIAPWVSVIIADVASSAPATTTIDRATPNTRPCTRGAHGEPATTSGPPAVVMMTTPIPM
jgi:hypothetical protein